MQEGYTAYLNVEMKLAAAFCLPGIMPVHRLGARRVERDGNDGALRVAVRLQAVNLCIPDASVRCGHEGAPCQLEQASTGHRAHRICNFGLHSVAIVALIATTLLHPPGVCPDNLTNDVYAF